MMSALFREKGAALRVEILEDKDVQSFIQAHAEILDSSFENTEMSPLMRQRLNESDYIFSGMKTFHELNEAFPQLLDEKGNRKPFEQFLNDVQKIDDTYNGNYLRAEYNFAQASAEMAAKWEQFEADGDDYPLQYRTAGDDKVRPEHAELHGITLPPSDSFWDEYFPPNGWNCRCTVVQVLGRNNPLTPHDEAMSRAKGAMTQKQQKMFAFNPGKQGRVFPAYNPYTISKCSTCPKALNLAADISDNECCSACNFVRSLIVSKGDLREEYNRFDPKQWRRHILTDSGYVVIDNNRPPEKDAHPNEYKKYHKELSMCEDLAHMGHRIKFLSELNRSDGTFDILFDDIAADLKRIDGIGSNIPKFTKHAFREQGAEIVVFCLPSHDSNIYDKLTEARRKYGNEGKIYFYFNDDMRLREI